MSARKGKPVFAYMFNPVQLPTESYGICAKYKRCGNIEPQILGNGLCLDCWDLKQYQFDRSSKKDKDNVN
tara:strand:- start:1451 stop:1660 length:210 start_codon:yes stop_codon:yes gene_type:complete